MDYGKWMMKAEKAIIEDLKPNERFEVKHLFPGHEWEGLERGEKISFGRYFSAAVNEGRIEMVERCGEGKSHHNVYQKK